MRIGICMNVKRDRLRTVEPVSADALRKLHTGTLLSRLQALRGLHESFEASDWLPEEREAVEAAGLIAFKQTDRWASAFADLKQILSEREHLERGTRQKRRDSAHRKRNR